MIRRDRNHPSVLMWEPILNETRYPLDFALKALEITKEEFPYPGRPVAAADVHSAGVKEHYDVVYGWPGDDEKTDRPEQCIFTREFGENVDDWYAHNNNNRASRSWGERPLFVQALSLAKSYGIRSIISAVIIPILIGEVYMMLSDKRNMPTKCSVVNHPPIFTIR